MTSDKTLVQMITVIERWAKSQNINSTAILCLLEDLDIKVEGNKSVKQTTAGLLERWRWIHKTEKANVYLCSVCHKNPVDAEAGFDTCSSCVKRGSWRIK